jgi:hypothetical protein
MRGERTEYYTCMLSLAMPGLARARNVNGPPKFGPSPCVDMATFLLFLFLFVDTLLLSYSLYRITIRSWHESLSDHDQFLSDHDQIVTWVSIGSWSNLTWVLIRSKDVEVTLQIIMNNRRQKYAIHELGFAFACSCVVVMVFFTPSADMHLQSKEQVSRTNRPFRSCTWRRCETARVLLDDCCWRHPWRLWIVPNNHRERYAIHELGFVSSCCCVVMVFISSTSVHQQLGEQVSITHRPRIHY